MAFKQTFGKLLYKLIAKHMPLSDGHFSFGSKRLRAFCGRLVLPVCGSNVNIERGAQFASDLKIGDNSSVGINVLLSPCVTNRNELMEGPA